MKSAELELAQVHSRAENRSVSDLCNAIESRVTIMEECISCSVQEDGTGSREILWLWHHGN